MTSQDLFSGAASATGNADSEGNDVVGGCFDGDSDASVNDRFQYDVKSFGVCLNAFSF